jgi:hypothetical protein
METCAHRTLKSLAIAFLRENGCAAVATEVRCPISRYKVDVAGYCDRQPLRKLNGELPSEPRTIVIECKQSRGDFLRDSRQLPQLLSLRMQIDRIRLSIEEHRIKNLEPQLRVSGSSLFRELEQWNFAGSRMPSYRRVLQRLKQIEQAIHGQTKFFLISHYALADELYLAAPKGLIRHAEIPPGWGLLECAAEDWLQEHAQGTLLGEAPALQIIQQAPQRASKPIRRLRLLRNIAVAASRSVR